jgi:hypothetical protein
MEHDILTKLHACRDGALFASRYPSIREAWDACERPDWLLWFAGRRLTGEGDSRTFVRIAIDVARLALPLFEQHSPKDMRVRDCLEVTQRWIDGKATAVDARAAADAAAAAAFAARAATYADAAAADAAADAAYAARAAAYAADAAAANAAAACADAAAAYAVDAACAAHVSYADAKIKCCKIIRQYIPVCP